MDNNHLIVVIKAMSAYIQLLIVLLNVAKWLRECEQRDHKRRTKRQKTSARFQAGAESEEFNASLSNLSDAASASSIPHQGEASSKKRKRKANVTKDVIKVIEKGLNSISEQMSKLVSVLDTPKLDSMPDELKKMGFDDDKCIAISMYFADNPNQLRLWNDMNATLKPTFVKVVLEELGM